jgi:formylglycine-generating enzyme required for sulfatase activity
MTGNAAIEQADTVFDGMLRKLVGAFYMGSDRQYPEQAPAHRLNVDKVFIAPVTIRQFKEFVRAHARR